MGLSAGLRQRARSLGADITGIAPAVLPETDGGAAAYREWVGKGMHGKMGYMARSPEDRAEITRWFPPARSVLLCAFSYHSGEPAPDAAPAKGRLARYALPPDYHDALKSRMRTLLAWYEENSSPPAGGAAAGGKPPARGKVFVDTSPVLERLYARYAGIGWVGKNTLIIAPKIGSFFLLAGLAVDRELNYNRPEPDHCGKCTRCLDACPTGAFPRPRVLDAARCIAYFTVELREKPIPAAFRKGHRDWVFGCDACQEACPWNRFALKSSVLAPRLSAAADLSELAGLAPEEFKTRFRGTPLHRTGHATLLRNVLLAMGNSRSPRYRKVLESFLEHADPLISEQARWSLNLLQ